MPYKAIKIKKLIILNRQIDKHIMTETLISILAGLERLKSGL